MAHGVSPLRLRRLWTRRLAAAIMSMTSASGGDSLRDAALALPSLEGAIGLPLDEIVLEVVKEQSSQDVDTASERGEGDTQ